MSAVTRIVCLISWDGEWETVAATLTYVGGQSRILCFSSDFDFGKLKEKVFTAIRIDSSLYDLQMCIQATYGQNKVLGKVAAIQDDDDVVGFIQYCRNNHPDLMPLYVTVVPRTRTIDAEVGKEGPVGTSNPLKDVGKKVSVDDSNEVETRRSNNISDTMPDENDNDLDDDFVNCHDLNLDDCTDHYDNDDHYHDGNDGKVGKIPIRRSRSECVGKFVPETSKEPENSLTRSYEIDDEDRRKRMADRFRWLPKVCDAPVIGSASIESGGSRGDSSLKVNDIFKNKRELQDALGKYAIDNTFEWKVYKSNKTLFEVKCKKAEECKWRATGRGIPGSDLFRLRRLDSMDLHTCGRDQICPHHRQAGQRVAGSLLRDRFDLENRVYRPKDIVFDFERDLSINLSYMQAWRARRWAIDAQIGSPEESYMLLPDYCENLKSTNPGTVTHIETDDDHHFKFFFMAIGASIRGFKEHI